MSCMLLSCLYLYCVVLAVLSEDSSSPMTNRAGEKLARLQKRAMSDRPRRSLQFTSTFHSSDCSQQKDSIPRNCLHAKSLGHSFSGVYEIDPRDGLGAFNVSCDMQTDGGGWTVFQRRKDGSENFYRTWNEYKEGFGELYGEFWLGLDKIHRLTATAVNLRVDLTAPDNSKAYAMYEDFTIGSEASMYAIRFGSYAGTAGDSLIYHEGMKFSTRDKDNDEQSTSCATSRSGAWWYKNCDNSNLNGKYAYSGSGSRYVRWHHFKGNTALKKVEMKLK